MPFSSWTAFSSSIAISRPSATVSASMIIWNLPAGFASSFFDAAGAGAGFTGSTTGAGFGVKLVFACGTGFGGTGLDAAGFGASASGITGLTGCALTADAVAAVEATVAAAAVAVADGTTAKTVDIKKVQKILCEEQDVPLPRQANTNKELVEELEAINYGRDFEFNKTIRQKAGLDW